MKKKLRIFLVIGGRATSLNGSKIWLRNFYDPLIELGHDVVLFDTDDFAARNGVRPSSPKSKDLLSDYLPRHFAELNRERGFDIFLSYLHNGQIKPAAMASVKNEAVPIINFTTNYHQFELYKEIAKIVDCNIYISKIAKGGFDSIGVHSYYMPLAASPTFYHPSSMKSREISFIGSAYGVRPYCLWRVLQNGIDLNIYGPGWKVEGRFGARLHTVMRKARFMKDFLSGSVGGSSKGLAALEKELGSSIVEEIERSYKSALHAPLNDDAYVRLLAESAIVINFNESRFDHDYMNHRVLLGCNLRDFETPMSGTFCLTEYSEELSSFFEDGKEVVSFRNEFELVDKLKYYIDHETERERIAAAGRNRALRDHTWRKRFENFLSTLEL